MRMDLVILDEPGYLPFSQAGGALLFHLLSKLYEHHERLTAASGTRQGSCMPKARSAASVST